MSQYTVLDCKFKNTWTSKAGRTYSSYKLKIDDGAEVFEVESALPVKTPEPEKGQMIEGDLEPGRFGTELRNAKVQGAGSSDGGKPEPFRKHPEEVAAVQRAHAQEMAVRQMGLLGSLGKLNGMSDEQLAAKLVSLIGWFEADVVRRGKVADLGNRLVDAGERAVERLPDAALEGRIDPGPDPAQETHEEMEERIRAEVLANNPPLQRMP